MTKRLLHFITLLFVMLTTMSLNVAPTLTLLLRLSSNLR